MNNDIERIDLDRIVGGFGDCTIFEDKKILITGGTGFLGYYLVKSLVEILDRGIAVEIYLLCRDGKKSSKMFSEYIEQDKLSIIVQDITIPIEIDLKFDFIIHAASPGKMSMWKKDYWGIIDANIIGYRHILELARRNEGCRLMFFSSSSIYGGLVDAKEKEFGRISGNSEFELYAHSKRICEVISVIEKDLDVVIVRPTVVYGPGMKVTDRNHTTDFVGDALRKDKIIIKGNGKDVRNYIYVSDAISAIFTVLAYGEKGGFYNIASSCDRIILDFANEVKKNVDLVDLEIWDNKETVNSIISENNEKLKSLGWSELISFEEGVKRFMMWAKTNDYFWK